MSAVPESYLTPADYLAIEREAEFKSEYSDGEMYAMSGVSREHNLITLNIASELRSLLRGSKCETYTSDMRVRISPPRRYLYPDVVIACGEAEFEDDNVDTLVNPVLIIEVLSPSTENYDRTTKFGWYRRIESLREYVLVSQDSAHIERYIKREEGWVLSDIDGLNATLRLASLNCEISLTDIYDRVAFPIPEEANDTPPDSSTR